MLRQGTWKSRSVRLWEDKTHGEHTIYVEPTGDAKSLEVRFNDVVRLEQYLGLMYGSVEWETTTA